MTPTNIPIYWQRAIGIYLDGRRLCLVEVARTLRGLQVREVVEADYEEAVPDELLQALLANRLSPRQRRHVPVGIGLSAEQTFFMTQPANLDKVEEATPEQLLEAGHYSKTITSETVVMDFCAAGKTPQAGTLWSLGACQRQQAQGLYQALKEIGLREVSLRPGLWSLATLLHRQGPDRSWKTCLHVLLHENGGGVLLESQGKALLWRPFKATPEQRVQTTISTLRIVMVHATTTLAVPWVAGVVLHGTGETSILSQAIEETLDLIPRQGRGDAGTNCDYALAQARAAQHSESLGFDLFASLKDTPSLLAMFPLRLTAVVVVMIGMLAWMLETQYRGLDREAQEVARQNDTHAWAKDLETGKIKKRQEDLSNEVRNVHHYLDSRVLWSNYLRDLPSYLPPNAGLSHLSCVNPLTGLSKKKSRKSKRSLTLRGATLFPEGRAAPEEIELYLDSLRQMNLLKKEFPKVELAEVKWRKEGRREVAMFTVVALPK